MSLKVTAEHKDRLIFDERTATVKELLDVVQRKWPDTPTRLIVFDPCVYDGDMFALALQRCFSAAFRPDGQLTLNPNITLERVHLAAAAAAGFDNLEKVTICWHVGALHLQRVK